TRSDRDWSSDVCSSDLKSTPLFWALHDEAKVRLLLDRGANINAKTADGRTLVLQTALMGNSMPVLRLLLEKGARPDGKTLNGMRSEERRVGKECRYWWR